MEKSGIRKMGSHYEMDIYLLKLLGQRKILHAYYLLTAIMQLTIKELEFVVQMNCVI